MANTVAQEVTRMIAAAWLLLTGLFIYKYIAAVRDEKEEAKRIAEFKEKYKIK